MTLVSSGRSWKYSPNRLFTGLTVTQLIAEIRSCRSQRRRIGVWPIGAKVRRTVGASMKPDSSRKTRCSPRLFALRTMLGRVLPLQWRIASSSRSLALFSGFWLVQRRRRLRILRTCSGWKETFN